MNILRSTVKFIILNKMNLTKYEILKFLIQASVNFLTSVKLTKSNIVKFVFATVCML